VVVDLVIVHLVVLVALVEVVMAAQDLAALAQLHPERQIQAAVLEALIKLALVLHQEVQAL
jgi:hypothetical protein